MYFSRKKKINHVWYIINSVYTAVAIVLVWRGIWILLDWIDSYFLGNTHWGTAVIGIIVGILMLYLPERKLEGFERL